MNTIKTLLIVLAISLTNFATANNTPNKENPSLIAKEISTLLLEPNFKLENDLNAKVTFILNSKNEIIVLDVLTDNDLIDSFIKSRLNYQVVSVKLLSEKSYEIPVRFVSK